MFQLIKQGDDFNIKVKFYICDTMNDLSAIDQKENPPCLAYVIEKQQKYILTYEKTWSPYSSDLDIPEEKIKELVEKFLAETKHDIDSLKDKAQNLTSEGTLSTDYIYQGNNVLIINGGQAPFLNGEGDIL